MNIKFPDNFLWGTATSGHQIEGHNVNSDWWEFEKQGKILDGTQSGKSVDYWNRYEEDHKLMSDLGYQAFRLGIEWAKIEPEKGKFNQDATKHYRKIFQSLKEHNIKICLTVYHWVLPLWVAREGGWENEKTIDWYSKFTEYVVQEFGEFPDLWVTINEPIVPAAAGYLGGEFPPEKKSIPLFLKIIEKLLRAHSRGYEIIHAKIPNAKVGIAQAYQWIEPYGSPHLKGLYEKIMAKIFRIGSYEAWDNAITTGVLKFPLKKAIYIAGVKNSYDWSGINYYTRASLKFDISKKTQGLIDFEAIPDGYEKTAMGWQIYPEGFYKILKYNWEKFKLPIYITENGIAEDADIQRPKYLVQHLLQVHRAIKDNCDIRGYFYWSFIDNFEWKKGFAMKFGLVECDCVNDPELKRKPRKSAYLYSDIIKNNGINDEILSKYNVKL